MKKDISLIILVVTIIVILILFAAVIITLAGDNNIISEAKDAVSLSNEAVIKEQLSLALAKDRANIRVIFQGVDAIKVQCYM